MKVVRRFQTSGKINLENSQPVYKTNRYIYPTVLMTGTLDSEETDIHNWNNYKKVVGKPINEGYYNADRTAMAGVNVNGNDSIFGGFVYNPTGSPINPNLSGERARQLFYNLLKVYRQAQALKL